MSRHILLLSYFYPPAPEVGGLRAAKVVAALRARGHRVTVITARLDDETDALRVEEPGLRVLTVVPWRHPQQAIEDWRAGRRPAAAPAAASAATPAPALGWDPDEQVPRWKRWILSFLWLPDYRQGFIPAAVGAATRVLAEDPADLLYTTAPPFSTHLAGLWLRWRRRLPWVTEFRDPWSDNPWKPARLRSRPAEALGRWLERRCLRASARIIPVSEGITRLLAAKLPAEHRQRVVTIRNGIDRLAGPPAPGAAGPRRIVYVGSFYLDRDPRPFLAALGEALARHPALRPTVAVDFVGRCRVFGNVDVVAEVERLGLADVVTFRDWVPHAESQRLVEGASVLLLLARGQPVQIPNKLYEYLGTRRPILAFVDEDGECAAMLRQVGGHQVVTEADPAAATPALERALGLVPDPGARAPDPELLTAWTSRVQMDRLVALIEATPLPGRSHGAPAPVPAPPPASPAARP